MSYLEIAPVSPQLRPFVDCFWISQSVNQAPQRIAPDGCADLIFARLDDSGSVTAPVIVGTMTRWSMATQPSGSVTVGVRFRPGGIYPFLHTPLHEFTDLTVPLSDVVPALGASFQQRLQESADWGRQLLLLEQWLTDTLRKYDPHRLPMLPVATYITHQRGQVSVEHLSDQANVSRRQLERQFQRYVGVSPKVLARIMRFQQVKTALKTNTTASLMTVAFDHGYTDHAHLTNEFKALLGLTDTLRLPEALNPSLFYKIGIAAGGYLWF